METPYEGKNEWECYHINGYSVFALPGRDLGIACRESIDKQRLEIIICIILSREEIKRHNTRRGYTPLHTATFNAEEGEFTEIIEATCTIYKSCSDEEILGELLEDRPAQFNN